MGALRLAFVLSVLLAPALGFSHSHAQAQAPPTLAPDHPPQEGDEPVPPQEGDEPVPPQEGDEPVPPQEGDEPAPPQEGDKPAPPPQAAPPQEGEPSQEGGDEPPAAPPTPAPSAEEPSQEGGDEPAPASTAPGTTPATTPAMPAQPVEPPAPSGDALLPELPMSFQAPFTLYVNHVYWGEIVITLEGENVWLARQHLTDAGVHLKGGTEQRFDGELLLSLKSVSPPLKYVLDERDISLHIDAPLENLPRTVVDLAGAPPDMEHQTRTSLFYNYSARLTDFSQVDVYQELGASAHGNLLFTSSHVSSVLGPRRGVTNYTINDRPTLRRLILGDSLVTTTPLGSGVQIGGFSMSRTYELDPYAIKSPQIGFVGETLTPATVDVYVNGARVRSEQLPPGTFQLDNLRVAGGSGEATYVIRDVFGQERTISMPFYLSSSVLAKGLDEYTYALGMIRVNALTESWGYERPAFLGRHRYGLTNSLTISGRAEAAEDVGSAGPTLTALTPVGQVELELAASIEQRGGAGFASFASYGYLGRRFGAGAFCSVVSDHYATVSRASVFDRATVEAGLFSSLPLSHSMTLAGNARFADYRDEGGTWLVNLQGSAVIIPQLTSMLSAGLSRLTDGETSWDIMFGVNYVFRQDHNTMVLGRVTNGTSMAQITANKSVPLAAGYGYRASALLGEVKSADAMLQYQTTFGRYAASYSRMAEQNISTVEVAGALALVPGVGLFPTLPVQDGFGIIRLPGVKNVRGYVNNQEIGRTNRQGNLLVPSMLSYYGNRLSIEPEDVPLAYNVQVTEVTVAPPQRGVAIAEFPMLMPHYYRGRMTVDDHGKRLEPKYGQLRVVQDGVELASPLGEHGEFELEGVNAGTHQAFVDYVDGSCRFQFEAPASGETVIELGEVLCTVP